MSDILKDKHFAFNVWDFESAKAVIDAGARCNKDVILQTSASIYKRIAAKSFSMFVKEYSIEKGIKAWLNLDHCKEKELLMDAVDNGWDMIMADGSSYNVEKNIEFVNDISKHAHERGVLVEGEVGQIIGTEDDINVIKECVASKEDIKNFVGQTEVDFIAVAFGNAHGEYVGVPSFRYDLIDYTIEISNKPFVVHGASGMPKVALDKLLGIQGVKKINISTDIKNAYRRGIKNANINLQPIKISSSIYEEVVKEAMSKLELIK